MPTYLARRGTTPRVNAKRTGSVTFVMTQAMANVPTRGCSRIYLGRPSLPVTDSKISQTYGTFSVSGEGRVRRG